MAEPSPSPAPESLEVLIPVRNPSGVFSRTVESLLEQTDANFSVLISDNYSTRGLEAIEQATARLQAKGIAARVVKPPVELGRVQHWNWLHHQSTAEWLKPLFVGDWLEPNGLAVCRAAMARTPDAAFLLFQYFAHRDEQPSQVVPCPELAGRLEPAAVVHRAITHGNFLGSPISVLYRRWAFQAAGGHQTSLPYLADFDLYTRLALQVPTYVLPDVLGHFLFHPDRFAKSGSGRNRESMNFEYALTSQLFRYYAFTVGLAVPTGSFLRKSADLLGRAGWELLLRQGGRLRRALAKRTG